MKDYCDTCGIELISGFYMCDEIEGLFCGECFGFLNCEEEHGEGCMTTVFKGVE